MAMTSSSFVVGTPFQAHTASPKRRSQIRTQALFKKKAKPEPVVEEKPQKSGLFGFGKKTKKGQPRSKREEELLAEAEKPRKKPSFLSGVAQALDFSEARSKGDAELLYQARYAKQDKMTPEQIAALKRKINGTSQDFWKEWVDVKGEYTDKGYVDTAQGVVGLPFLVAVVLGVFGALAYVVSQTSAPPAV